MQPIVCLLPLFTAPSLAPSTHSLPFLSLPSIKGIYRICHAPLTCPEKFRDLSGPLKVFNPETNFTAKVRVKSKTEIKRGHQYEMFFMHVFNIASKNEVNMWGGGEEGKKEKLSAS